MTNTEKAVKHYKNHFTGNRGRQHHNWGYLWELQLGRQNEYKQRIQTIYPRMKQWIVWIVCPDNRFSFSDKIAGTNSARLTGPCRSLNSLRGWQARPILFRCFYPETGFYVSLLLSVHPGMPIPVKTCGLLGTDRFHFFGAELFGLQFP